MFENKTGRLVRCPHCFSKDMDVFLLYDDEKDEFYCYKCCFCGKLEKVNEQMETFLKNKYVVKRYFDKE